MKIDSIELQKVLYMPSDFKEGILYVSKKFGVAAHLCACGCGNKVITPLGATEWTIKEEDFGVSVYPSIGNGQLPCKSHYLINNGKIIWCDQMTESKTHQDFKKAEVQRALYYSKYNRHSRLGRCFRRIFNAIFCK